MKLRNLSRWVLTPENEGLLFFAQRVDELLYDFSLDTYKPPALNAPNLCIEALDLVREIQRGTIEAANLQFVLDELVWSLQRDPVAKSLLDADVSYYTLSNDQTPLSTTKLRLEVLARTVNPTRYFETLQSRLDLAVSKGDKRDIDFLATTLITTLTNAGVSKSWLHDQTHAYFFSPDGPSIDASSLDGFLKLVNQDVHTFTIYVVTSALIRQVIDSISAFNAEILDGQPEGTIGDLLLTTPLRSDEVVVKLQDIKCRDPHSARLKGLKRLDNLSDLFTLFYHRRRITWRPEVVVEWKYCAFEPRRCDAPRGPMEKAFDLKEDRAARQLNLMLSRFAGRRDKDSFQRFNRVVDLHGICVAHDIAENQLVNLWTAIETLVPSHVGKSKIKQVVSAIIPFTSVSYIRRIIDRLLSDLLVWDKWRTKKLLDKVDAGKGAALIERLAVLLLSPSHESLRIELYSRLGDFHLLRYRAFNVARELASSRGVIARLDAHEKKVAWQLRRLYRARNLIVHTSQSPSYTATLIENGHDYLDSILFQVITRSCGSYQAHTIEQAFELTAVAYQKLRNDIAAEVAFEGNRARLLVMEA